jgi:hypothetical protein
MRSICAASRNALKALALSLIILAPLILPVLAYSQSGEKLPKAYLEAVKDAENAEPQEISKDLIAIAPYNQRLVWKKDAEHGLLVKVVTWMPNTANSGPEYKVGVTTAPAGYDDANLIWVTAVPQIKSFCQRCCSRRKDSNIAFRVQQVLGMPPAKFESSKFVEFWAHPKDIFRPTPDPEINDHEAELNFPVSDEFVTINQEYKDWFNKHKATVYAREIPGTWTRLGYTYDWGNPKNHVGMSEFIIRPGARIEVTAIYSIEEYCR